MELITEDNGLYVETKGLKPLIGYEVCASVEKTELASDCLDFVRCISEYVKSGEKIYAGETIQYGYWLTKAMISDGKFSFWEYNVEATEFVAGINNTLFYWVEQNQVCKKANASFEPPVPDQLIVISDGVYEGDDVEGVRYPSPEHMSGWWLTTDRYDGNIKSLRTVHAHHVTANRPDLAKFLALPYGHRFFSSTGDTWIDSKINAEISPKKNNEGTGIERR